MLEADTALVGFPSTSALRYRIQNKLSEVNESRESASDFGWDSTHSEKLLRPMGDTLLEAFFSRIHEFEIYCLKVRNKED
jgi:hypothetical protein